MATGFSDFPTPALAPTLFSRCYRVNRPRSGELTEITINQPACQLLFASFFRGRQNQQLNAVSTTFERRKCRRANLAVFPRTNKTRCLDFSEPSAALAAGVSHVECLESMAYKNQAVKPLLAQLSLNDSDDRPSAPRTPARRSPDPRKFWPEYQRSCDC